MNNNDAKVSEQQRFQLLIYFFK